MKYMKSFIILMMGLLLAACGSDDNDIPAGETYTQSVTLPAAESELEVQLTGLTTEINTISGAEDWLLVTKDNVKKICVKLVAKANEGKAERSCVVTIDDKAGNKVLLTVKQIVSKSYSKSVTLPAAETELELQLTGLTAEITNISGAKEWLTVMKTNASNPTVKLLAKVNEGEAERSCVLTIDDKAGNKVLLTVKQVASKKYSQSVTFPAVETEKEVQLTGLTAEIENITGAKEWLTITKNNMVKSGIKLLAKANEGEGDRSCVVTITDKVGDKVLLTAKQVAAKKYSQSVTLPATEAVQEIQLTNLTAEIKDISGAKTWLSVTIINATQRRVKLVATDNEGEEERSCVVTITDKVGDKVLLTVKQVAGKIYSQSVTLPATEAVQEIQLTGLTAEIKSISGAKTWLSVTIINGTQKKVKLVATDNESEMERSCDVIITDKAANRVLLTVKQSKINDPIGHDFKTDQPAYTPRKP